MRHDEVRMFNNCMEQYMTFPADDRDFLLILQRGLERHPANPLKPAARKRLKELHAEILRQRRAQGGGQ